MGSLAFNTQGTPPFVTQVLLILSKICRFSMGNNMYIWTSSWTKLLVIGNKYSEKMKNLFTYQSPDATARIGYESFGFTFSSCPTKAVSKLSSLAAPYLTSGFTRKPQLLNYGFFNVLKVGGSPKFLENVYHYRGQFGRRGQLSHATNLTVNGPVVNNLPDIALIKEHLRYYPIKWSIEKGVGTWRHA